MHFLKAAFITAGFFAGFVLGKDLAITVLARMTTAAPGAASAPAA
jgi:multisubunit Na+/H+ antiporter MnhE subunit